MCRGRRARSAASPEKELPGLRLFATTFEAFVRLAAVDAPPVTREASSMADAQRMKEDADNRMREAEVVKLGAERDVARIIQAERSFQQHRADIDKKKHHQAIERERRDNAVVVAHKEGKIIEIKAKAKQEKRKAEEAVVEAHARVTD